MNYNRFLEEVLSESKANSHRLAGLAQHVIIGEYI